MRTSTANILARLDLERVQQKVHETILPEFEYEGVATRILHAADLFLEDDLESDQMLVEYDFDMVARGIFDLVLVKGDKAKIVDWKTTGSLDRPNALEEIRHESQSSLYLTYGAEDLVTKLGIPEPTVLDYRVIDERPIMRTKNGQEYVAAPAHVSLISVAKESWTATDAMTLMATTEQQFLALWDMPVWTRRRPKACFVGYERGPVCPFWEDCTHMTMPAGNGGLVALDKVPRSKSAIKDFLECPERYRRLRVLGAETSVQKPLPILKGEAFHAGIADIYEQAWELKQKGDLK